MDCAPDLSEPVHAWAVVGGLVPQSPARSGSAVAAGHRLPDGPPAEAAGFKQRLPALSGHHLWYVPLHTVWDHIDVIDKGHSWLLSLSQGAVKTVGKKSLY